MTLFVFLYFILIKKDVFVGISHMPACISNQSAPSNAICTVVTDPTEAILQAMVLLLYFMILHTLRHLPSDRRDIMYIIIISLHHPHVSIRPINCCRDFSCHVYIQPSHIEFVKLPGRFRIIATSNGIHP
jgi:hypothetical protein